MSHKILQYKSTGKLHFSLNCKVCKKKQNVISTGKRKKLAPKYLKGSVEGRNYVTKSSMHTQKSSIVSEIYSQIPYGNSTFISHLGP